MTRRRRYGRLGNMEDLPSGGSQPSLSVAFCILTGASGFALNKTSASANYAFGTFTFLVGHGLIGLIHTTRPDPPDLLRKIFRQTSILAEVAPLALLNAEFYLLSGFDHQFAYAHLLSAFLPTIVDLTMEEHTAEAMDVCLTGNLLSLLYLQIAKETGVWTGGLLALTALNHFVFKQLSSRYNVPKMEVVTVGLSFFTVFALNCLRDLKA